jgi:hypothetical protein
VNPTDGSHTLTSVDSRIEARIAELASQIRGVLRDPEASSGDVERAMAVLVPELQRLAEHVEAAGGPRFARVCESCGGLDLRTRWRTLSEAEDAVALSGGSWTCRWCGSSDFVVLEVQDAVRVGGRGPRAVPR